MNAAHHATKAFAYAESGDVSTARQQMAAALEKAPFLTLAFYSKAFNFKNPADWNRFAHALRKAGLPEE